MKMFGVKFVGRSCRVLSRGDRSGSGSSGRLSSILCILFHKDALLMTSVSHLQVLFMYLCNRYDINHINMRASSKSLCICERKTRNYEKSYKHNRDYYMCSIVRDKTYKLEVLSNTVRYQIILKFCEYLYDD